MVYMYHSFLIHSSADGHLGCFHVLAIINSAVMNIGVHVSLSDLPYDPAIPLLGIHTEETRSASGLNCGIRDLLVTAHKLLVVTCGI